MSIALFPEHDADCLDIENGAATPESAASWYLRQKARGVSRPVLYASASVMEANVVPVITAAGIVRAEVRLWTAHYSYSPHICGPESCGLLGIDADGTQWTDRALGRDLDQSLLLASFFGSVPPAPPSWTEKIMKALPTVKQGATDHASVRRVQALVNADREGRGLSAIKEDGIWGPVTASAVSSFQAAAGIAKDSVVGPATWGALLGVS